MKAALLIGAFFAALTASACAGNTEAPGAGGTPATTDEAVAAAPEILIPAPDLPDLILLNQDAEQLGLADLRGRPALLTFIYTRCPMPDMCPATTLRFQEVQKALTATERERVRLISVSFDPFDTPEVLAEYGDLWEADTSFWSLLTGTEQDVQALASAYGVWFEQSEEDETFRHPMYTMILLPDGSLHQVLLGSVFDSAEVAQTLLSLASDTGSATR